MKNFVYFIFIKLLLFIYLVLLVDDTSPLLNICILFNLLNFTFIFLNFKNNNKLNSIPKIINILFNFSVIIFNYPDLLVSDTRINFYGEELFVLQAFKLIIFYQLFISIFLKTLENNNFARVNLNKINFYNVNLVKTILQINLFSFLIYIFGGNNISNLFQGRGSGLYGSFFKIVPFKGGLSTFFLVFNFFIQFSTIIGFLFILNYFLNKILKNKIDSSNIKIPNLYKIYITLIALLYLFSAFFSDVRGYIFIILFPLIILFFETGKSEKKINFTFTIQTLNTLKILFFCIIIFLTIIGSEIQVYRRGNINFFERDKTDFYKSQGVIQTDKALYNLSEIIKLTPKGGTEAGKIKFKNVPYQFIPSFLAPNKPTRVNNSSYKDVANSIFNNFNYKFYNISIQITYLGEFILAFGLLRGFILAVISSMFILFLIILILKNFIGSIFYPFISTSLMSLTFFLARSQFQYLQELSLFIYSLLFLWIYYLLRYKFLKIK